MDKVFLINIYGKTIPCLHVSGEPRLPVSQVIHFLTEDGFNNEDVLATCAELSVNFKKCTPEQLKSLLTSRHYTFTTKTENLITKSDVERLFGRLLQKNMRGSIGRYNSGLLVNHDCFGGCEGLLAPELYFMPNSSCIECLECHLLLSPQQFVSHSHSKLEGNTKHWGFSSSRWRLYVFTSQYDKNKNRELDEVKKKFVNTEAYRDEKSRTEDAKSAITKIVDVTSPGIMVDIPPHLCLDEPVLTFSDGAPGFLTSQKADLKLVPNVSLALFDKFGKGNLEMAERLKPPPQCQKKITRESLKHYKASACSIFRDFVNDVPLHELCESDFIGNLMNIRKELFSAIVSKANTSNKQEFRQNFELMQKHGMDLVYFLLESKADLYQKLKLLG